MKGFRIALFSEGSKAKPGAILAAFALALLLASCGGDRRGPVSWDAKVGHCPVCDMKVKVEDEWASEIRYKDGTKLVSESPGDLLEFYSAPERYNVTDFQKVRTNIDKILLKEYNTKQHIDAAHATLVYKSRMNGPMGPDVFAFRREDDARSFAANNGGEVLTLSELTPEMVRNLRRR